MYPDSWRKEYLVISAFTENISFFMSPELLFFWYFKQLDIKKDNFSYFIIQQKNISSNCYIDKKTQFLLIGYYFCE